MKSLTAMVVLPIMLILLFSCASVQQKQTEQGDDLVVVDLSRYNEQIEGLNL